METVLVSACLVGEAVRYNAAAVRPDGLWLGRIARGCRLLPFCPEVAAGLPVPRQPVEIVGGDGRAVLQGRAFVRDARGQDLSAVFREGAELALEICREHGIQVAILAENSPSCGSGSIYDGSFTGMRVPGSGVTAARLADAGLFVCSQQQVDELLARAEGGSLRIGPCRLSEDKPAALPAEKARGCGDR